jgi:hypothetical protein
MNDFSFMQSTQFSLATAVCKIFKLRLATASGNPEGAD